MIIKKYQLEKFLNTPNNIPPTVLLYGPDNGLIRETIKKITKKILPDPDPFHFIEVDCKKIISEPNVLFNEVDSITFDNQKKVILINNADNALKKIIEKIFTNQNLESTIIIDGGDLAKGSSLRTLLEKNKEAVVIPCYRDENEDLEKIIKNIVSKNNMTIESSAVSLLLEYLGSDRLITINELNKLILYVGDRTSVTKDDVANCIKDNSYFTLENIAFAIASGELSKIEKYTARAFREGIQPNSLIYWVVNHFLRLHTVSALIKDGETKIQAMSKLRPPIFFKLKDQFSKQLLFWHTPKIEKILDKLNNCEIDIKSSAVSGELLCKRLFLSIGIFAKS